MPDYTPTFAELCSAIADGGVIATLDGSVYEINAFELRRYFSKARVLPGFSSEQQESLDECEESSHLFDVRLTQRH